MSTQFTFSANVRPEQLQNEINNSTDFTATCTGVDVNFNTDVTVNFNTDLTGDEETALTALVAAHVPEIDPVDAATLPYSRIGKLAVHASSMPQIPGKTFYDVFCGSGDDVVNHIPGAGDLVVFAFAPSISSETKHIRFDPQFGDVYVHGGYVKYSGADFGDTITCDIMSGASPLLTHTVPLDLEVYDNEHEWVRYVGVGGSPIAGTHGMAGTPILIPRTNSMDGDWDYSEDTGLVPNFAGTGLYKISAKEITVHRYVNRLPCIGDSGAYLEIESSEAGFLPPGYHIDVTATNASGSSWTATFIINVYREQTISP